MMKLYSYWRSSCSWRARIVLALKGVDYKIVPVHLLRDGGQQNADHFAGLNPMRQVPVLEWEDNGTVRRLTQSLAICAYLEARFPEPRLYPADPFLAGRAREIAEMINAGIQPLQNLRTMKRLKAGGIDPVAWNREVVERGFEAVEHVLEHTSSTFSVGDHLSMADVCLVPQVYNARRFEVDMGRFPRITMVDAACSSLEPFQVSHPSRQPDAEAA